MSVSNQPNEYSEPSNSPESRTPITSLRNGLIGGVLAVILSFLPLSTVLGGGVAGYLDRSTGRHGVGAGAIAGIVSFIPYLLVGSYLVLSPTVMLPGPELGVSPLIVIAGMTGFALLYAVGLSVLGSLIGGYFYDKR